ncbi:hypothetical protein Klosneuvirus_1_189 [Klosneuvirus KNV1]|uniref:Uncharacterized protein n=1 Tax=Klosneuvirus KNV1 TaxID=1977640 RepID=A0A1V0SHY8_9VIRU|nr:hypothetical protein Klosneuvirus_1_189 [Klosneuvirus KNV1]
MDDYYEEQTFTGNNHVSYNSRIETLDPVDELAELYDIREKMENDIRGLWESVIVPYLNDYRYNDILNNLTVNDYHKFYEYMIDNNEMSSYIYERIYELENFQG